MTRVSFTFGLVLLFVSLIGCDDTTSDHQPVSKPPGLEGKWDVVSKKVNGNERALKRTHRFTFSNGRLHMADVGSDVAIQGDYTISTESLPHTLTLYADGKIYIRAIYTLQGDSLKVCFGSEAEAPTDFAANRGRHHELFVLKRVE